MFKKEKKNNSKKSKKESKSSNVELRVQTSYQSQTPSISQSMQIHPLDPGEEIAIQAAPHIPPPVSISDVPSCVEDSWEKATTELDEIKKIVSDIAKSNSLMVFSGAGLSIPSISFDSLPPMELEVKYAIRDRNYYEIQKTKFRENMQESYLFGTVLKILNSVPNRGHNAIVNVGKILDATGKKLKIVTQNLDYLHEEAEININGENSEKIKDIHHIHGWLKIATCPKCNKVIDYARVLEKLRNKPKDIDIMLCGRHSKTNCKGVLTPDMIEYGEEVVDYNECEDIAKVSDVILIVGTSLRVTPANRLVNVVHDKGGKVFLFNRSYTPKDPLADIHIRSDLDCTLPLLANELKRYMIENNKENPEKIDKIDSIKLYMESIKIK